MSKLKVKLQKGFTLVELMIVIVIIAILAGVGITAYRGVTSNARDAKKKADVEAIALAFEKNYNPNTGIYYPSELEGTDFTSGEVPKAPDNQDYYISPIEQGSDRKTFTVCALLKDSSVFCRQSTNGSAENIPTLAELKTLEQGGTTDAESEGSASPSPSAAPSSSPSSAPSSAPSVAPTATPTPTSTPTPTPTPSPAVTFKRVFITKDPTGIFGGLVGADKICDSIAKFKGLTGTYKAWLSDTTISANSRLSQSTVPYKNIDGSIVASNWADLTNGGLSGPFKDENGQPVSGGPLWVWTNTDPSGNKINSPACVNWTTTESVSAVGDANGYNGPPWTIASQQSCSISARLYCLEQ